MSISDRLLGKKNVNGHPHIEAVAPSAALPGGEVRIVGSGLRPNELRRPRVKFGDVEAPVIICSDDFVVFPRAQVLGRLLFRRMDTPATRIRLELRLRSLTICIQ